MNISARAWLAVGCFITGLLGPGNELLAQSKGPASRPASRDPLAVAAAIDREVDRRLREEKVPPSPPADDAEFLRRVYLDITGRIPTAQQALAFLDRDDPNKRRQLIDELLARPEYGQHFSRLWQLLIYPAPDDIFFSGLVGRPGMEAFGRWLADSFSEGHGWDRMVRQMLTAEGSPAQNPAVVFSMSNMEKARVRPDLLGVSTGQLFLGVRLQCVECHDHFYADWKQTDLWGLAAFFGQVRFASDRPVSIVDFMATICQVLGINYRKRLETPGGRKMPIVDLQTQENPRVLVELF